MKRYHFNREERFYCSVLMVAIQQNSKVASTIFQKVTNKNDIEAYVETSIVRDHWMRLGKPTKKNKNTVNERRKAYLKKLCSLINVDFSTIENRTDYYSKNKYIQSPGNWKKLGSDNNDIRNLRAVFNMRQDILIIEDRNLHFIEAKLDSGNSQQQIENLFLLKKLHDKSKSQWACIDEFKNIENVHLYYIKRNNTPLRVQNPRVHSEIELLTWSQVFNHLANEPIYKYFRLEDHKEILS